MTALPPQPPPPIPLTVVTGFLGAGKTTFLNRALAKPYLGGTLVVVNEFGTAPLDQHLIAVDEDELALLSSGCLCCTIRGSLARLLEDILRRKDNRRMPDFVRVVIETTGLADPVPVLASVLAHPYLSRRYRLSGVVTVVDALHVLSTLTSHAEARRQVLLADTLLLSKSDVEGSRGEEARDALLAMNPLASVMTTSQALDTAGWHPFDGQFALAQRSGEARSLLWRESLRLPAANADHSHDPDRHGKSILAFSIALSRPLDRPVLDALLGALSSAFGKNLLRLKGLVALAGDPDRPLAVHMVQGTVAPTQQLERWPDGVVAGWLQVIGQTLDEAAVRAIVSAFSPPA